MMRLLHSVFFGSLCTIVAGIHRKDVEYVLVQVDASKVVSNTASNFICATLDWWPNSKDKGAWEDASLQVLDLDAPLVRNALKALSPLHLRLGGSLQDQIMYTNNKPSERVAETTSKIVRGLKATKEVAKLSTWPDWNRCEPLRPSNSTYSRYEGGCLHLDRLKEISQLCDATGCQIVFGLGYFFGRNLTGQRDWSGLWDPSNSDLLLRYARDEKLSIAAFELGNEVDGDNGILARFPADQYAHDLTKLRQMINKYWGSCDGPGCDCSRPLLTGVATAKYNKSYAEELLSHLEEDVLDVFTHHNYMLGMSEDPLVRDRILDPSFIEQYKQLAYSVSHDVREIHPKIQVWMGEAGGAAHSGREGVTDAFISSFWYLDQLAQSALNGHQAFCRQTLVGGHYSLLRSAHGPPNPDFYAAWMWRKLMGTQVLSAWSNSSYVRAYAHCARNNHDEKTGQIVLVLSNLHREQAVTVDMKVMDEEDSSCPSNGFREEYLFSALFGNINGQELQLNGKLLHVYEEQLPTLEPRRVECGSGLLLPPVTYAFVVLPGEIVGCSVQK